MSTSVDKIEADMKELLKPYLFEINCKATRYSMQKLLKSYLKKNFPFRKPKFDVKVNIDKKGRMINVVVEEVTIPM